jgi:GT2 family glycosyltransferase
VKKFSVIIINYNTADLTAQTVRSFYRHHPREQDFEMIVVDNASRPAERARLRRLVKRAPTNFTLLESETNLGFGGGNNWAARQATGRLLFFLNSDTIITQNLLKPIADFLKQTKRAALVAPELKLKDGRAQPHAYGAFPTLWSLIRNHLPGGKEAVSPTLAPVETAGGDGGGGGGAAATDVVADGGGAVTDTTTTTDTAGATPLLVDWVSGGAMVVRATLFWQVGGFTPDYFMYFEDVDLSKKLQVAGYQAYVLPSSSLIHLGGQSVRLRGERRRLYFQSQDVFFRKFYPPVTAFLVRLLRRLI